MIKYKTGPESTLHKLSDLIRYHRLQVVLQWDPLVTGLFSLLSSFFVAGLDDALVGI